MLGFGYVVMPEHVHFLVSEPETELLSTAIRAMKQSVARTLIGEPGPPVRAILNVAVLFTFR